MPLLVRLNDARAADELVDSLRTAHTEVRRRGARTVVVADGDDLEVELLFFLKARVLSDSAFTFELDRV
jgi:hypothetical protein